MRKEIHPQKSIADGRVVFVHLFPVLSRSRVCDSDFGEDLGGIAGNDYTFDRTRNGESFWKFTIKRKSKWQRYQGEGLCQRNLIIFVFQFLFLTIFCVFCFCFSYFIESWKMKRKMVVFLRSLTVDELSGNGSEKVKIKKKKQNKQKRSCEWRDGCCMQKQNWLGWAALYKHFFFSISIHTPESFCGRRVSTWKTKMN